MSDFLCFFPPKMKEGRRRTIPQSINPPSLQCSRSSRRLQASRKFNWSKLNRDCALAENWDGCCTAAEVFPTLCLYPSQHARFAASKLALWLNLAAARGVETCQHGLESHYRSSWAERYLRCSPHERYIVAERASEREGLFLVGRAAASHRR